MKLLSIILLVALASAADRSRAEASLASCSKQKHKQLELTARNRQGTPARTRRKKHSDHIVTRQKIARIDDWLWKNCRSHAAEMRTIEQQYM